MPCWEVAPSSSPFAALASYLPWRPNSTLTMLLGDKADFFITDTMNGCTFAFGAGGEAARGACELGGSTSGGARPVRPQPPSVSIPTTPASTVDSAPTARAKGSCVVTWSM